MAVGVFPEIHPNCSDYIILFVQQLSGTLKTWFKIVCGQNGNNRHSHNSPHSNFITCGLVAEGRYHDSWKTSHRNHKPQIRLINAFTINIRELVISSHKFTETQWCQSSLPCWWWWGDWFKTRCVPTSCSNLFTDFRTVLRILAFSYLFPTIGLFWPHKPNIFRHASVSSTCQM